MEMSSSIVYKEQEVLGELISHHSASSGDRAALFAHERFAAAHGGARPGGRTKSHGWLRTGGATAPSGRCIGGGPLRRPAGADDPAACLPAPGRGRQAASRSEER